MSGGQGSEVSLGRTPSLCPGCAFCWEHPSLCISVPNSHSLFQTLLGRYFLRWWEVDWGASPAGGGNCPPLFSLSSLFLGQALNVGGLPQIGSNTHLPGLPATMLGSLLEWEIGLSPRKEMKVQRGEETYPRTPS